MRRNKLALLGMLFISLQVNAWNQDWTGNWLVGASAGYGSRTGSNQTQLSYNGSAFPITYPQSVIVRDFSAPGMIGGLFMGYQAVKTAWLVGGELNVDYHDMNDDLPFAFTDAGNTAAWTGVTHYKRDIVFGMTARVGYALAPFFMPYVRVGLELGRDTLTTRYASQSPVYALATQISTATYVHRALSGFGIEMPLPMTCGATFRLEYNWHSKSKTVKAHGALLDGIISPAFESALQPQTHSGRAALIWNFF